MGLFSVFHWLFVIFALAISFLPTIIAFSKGHVNKWAIFLLNLFLGFTIIGWVVALIWAIKKPEVMAIASVE